ncbi:hypothetical protein PGT21_028603 [Puccinia graminis f. sp. tritici]|uniref:Uncharacterized protein n=1 Tax=Puccinia graminis f. sp. tritici TaxID=56615 RepID=A0A5B0S5E4_PUCGR|nr:hypothetical protein PGT21_028603 [Puccinia graminis f. sp. tritici]KAA1133007.1 hypothetical protein PGTUg99_021895 [Puccinia graminis f. sp. tritici]
MRRVFPVEVDFLGWHSERPDENLGQIISEPGGGSSQGSTGDRQELVLTRVTIQHHLNHHLTLPTILINPERN